MIYPIPFLPLSSFNGVKLLRAFQPDKSEERSSRFSLDNPCFILFN